MGEREMIRWWWLRHFGRERCHCGAFADMGDMGGGILWCRPCKYGVNRNCPCSREPYSLPDEFPDRKPRVWFYRPQLHWRGWRTLLPLSWGGDEFWRTTLVIGWAVTGQIVVALWHHESPYVDA